MCDKRVMTPQELETLQQSMAGEVGLSFQRFLVLFNFNKAAPIRSEREYREMFKRFKEMHVMLMPAVQYIDLLMEL